MSLKQLPSFQQLFNACRVLKLTSSIGDMDRLYDEYSSTKTVMQGIVSQPQLSVSDKWVLFFQSCQEVPATLFQFVSFVLSVPSSNAFPERIFSLMNAKCRQERNRMAVSLIKSELQVYTNYTFSCHEFHSFVLSDQKLIDAAARNDKYKWKHRR